MAVGDAACSLAFEVLIPLTLTTALFWVVILPKAVEQTTRLAKHVVKSIRIAPCSGLLQISLRRLMQTREGLANVRAPHIYTYILAANVILIAGLAAAAMLLPPATGVPAGRALGTFAEIAAIYAIVAMGQIFFIREIAFKYAPETPDVLFGKIAGDLAFACFDAPVASVGCPSAARGS